MALITPAETCEFVVLICGIFCLHGNIRPGYKTSLVFFGALKLFFNFYKFF